MAVSLIQKIRLANLETLIKETGNVAELARRCGYNKPTYLYQIRAQQPKPNGKTMQIGRNLAAKLEEAMGKPAGWMSIDHVAERKAERARKKAERNKETRQVAAVQTVAFPENNASSDIQTITLALTGASGMPYACLNASWQLEKPFIFYILPLHKSSPDKKVVLNYLHLL